ncbi:hypothetical protein HanRHA438_Chr05g0240571 [Helianthus annuus]|nr:hypothetical protein HanRHA438_Chr05g0240571 [Helianthus annuus]
MNNPISLFPLWCSSFIENQSFLHSDQRFSTNNLLIFSSRFPVTRLSRSIRP